MPFLLPALPALVSAGTSIFGAVNSGNNAKKTEGQINQLYQPYTNAGANAINQVNNLLTPGFDANSWLQSQPGYQFQFDQGAQGLNRQENAAGTLNSGGAQKAAIRYGQGAASTGFQNAFNNLLRTGALGQVSTNEMADNIFSGNQAQTTASNGLAGSIGGLVGNLFNGGTSQPTYSSNPLGQLTSIAPNAPLLSGPLNTNFSVPSFGGI